MKRVATTLTFVFAGMIAYAQQDPQFSMNMYNKLSINPAYAGSNDAICANLLARSQWVGFPGAPKTALIGAEMPVPLLWGGVGLTITGDKIGFDQNINVKAAYAFRHQVGPGKLSAGVAAGIFQKSTNGTWIYNQPNDPTIPLGQVAGTVPDFDFGVYYYTNDLRFGLSSTHLAEASINYGTIKTSLARHYFILAEYDFRQLHPDIVLQPSTLIKSDAASTQLDVNLKVLYKNQFWGGFSYRVQDALVLMVGMHWQAWKFGYAYDITTSEIKNYSGGSHEIMLGYCFKPSKKTVINKNKNVRFL